MTSCRLSDPVKKDNTTLRDTLLQSIPACIRPTYRPVVGTDITGGGGEHYTGLQTVLQGWYCDNWGTGGQGFHLWDIDRDFFEKLRVICDVCMYLSKFTWNLICHVNGKLCWNE